MRAGALHNYGAGGVFPAICARIRLVGPAQLGRSLSDSLIQVKGRIRTHIFGLKVGLSVLALKDIDIA